MNINFPLILVIAVLMTGLIWLVDALFFARKRKGDHTPLIAEYARSFFPILLIVLIIRSFLFEPFRIPSSSLEPSLLVGDFILVNKYNYGLRLPVLDKKFISVASPKRGDIMVFHWPPNPKFDFIKRVIGLPGDHINIINKTLFINGKSMPQQELEQLVLHDEYGNSWKVIKAEENLDGKKHLIYLRPGTEARNYYDIVVPPGQYFMMGDNRDDSQDSRYWGFVPDQNIVGKAVAVWFSWNSAAENLIQKIRWNRIALINK